MYDYLISRSIVLDKLSINLLLSNIIIIKNDPVTKSNNLIKEYTGKHDYEAIDKIIDRTYKFRDRLYQFKEYFNLVFNKGRHEKIFLNLDKKITDICAKSSQNNNALMLNRKKRRDDEEDELGYNVILF